MQHKALFDIEIIKNNIEFPLTFDGYGYIFDQDGTMIAQKCKNLSRESAQDFVNLVNSFDLNNKFKPIISIRGWGHWQYVPNGENIYKNIANFLTYCCNCENFDVNLLQN
jgi:hypothetical protein